MSVRFFINVFNQAVAYFRKSIRFATYNSIKAIRKFCVFLIDSDIKFLPLRAILFKILSSKLKKMRKHIAVPGKAKNKILFVAPSLGAGGSERQMTNLLSALKERKYKVELLLENSYMEKGHNYFRPELDKMNIPVHDLNEFIAKEINIDTVLSDAGFRSPKIFMPDYQIKNLKAYIAFFRKKKPKVVHAWLDPINTKAGLAAYLCGVPKIILSCRSVNPSHFQFYRSPMRSIYQFLIRDPSVVILNNSEAGAEDYARWLKVPKSKIRVIRNGVNFSPSSRIISEKRKKIPVIGTIFRLTEEKQPLLWIEMARDLLNRGLRVRFLVVAAGPMMKQFLQQIDSYKLKKHFIIKSHPKKVTKYLREMDVFVLTSRKEGSPNVLLEAQSMGIPVVSTDAGGAKETFINDITGILAAESSAHELAASVDRALSSKTMKKESKHLAPIFVKEKFGMERFVQQNEDLYKA